MAYNERQKRLSSVGGLPKFKVVLLGEVGVGKSALFIRMKDGVFGEKLQPTVGIESCSKIVSADCEKIIFQVWDTAGVERYRTLTRNYYRNTHATLLVYSLDNPASLHYLSKWVEDTHDSAPNALKFLIGNKLDLDRSVSDKSIEDFAVAHDCEGAYTVSAKDGTNIDAVLSSIGEKLLNSFKVPTLSDSMFDESIHLHTKPNSDLSSECRC